jgi:hypothetical protein
VIAAAYINSMKGAKETTLFDIEAGLGAVFRQAPPNDGVLSKVGSLGVNVENASFDIATDPSGLNVAMLLTGGKLYTVDLASGKATSEKKIAGLPENVIDIAVLPAGPMKQAEGEMTMPGGAAMKTDMKAGMAPAPAMRQDGYLPPKIKPMADDMKPTAKEKMAYGAQENAYMAPKMKPMKKAGGYAKQADDDDDDYEQDVRPVHKMKKAKGPQCDREAHY